MISHRTNKLHACKYCDKKFNIKHHLKNHEKTHENDKPFHCKECVRQFINQDALNRHSLVHKNTEYICDFCQKVYHNKFSLREHLHGHIIDPNFMCAKCGATFSTEFLLRIHARRVHKTALNKDISTNAEKVSKYKSNNGKIVYCKICKINFETNKALHAHVKVSGFTYNNNLYNCFIYLHFRFLFFSF